jgi:two-component system, chemotaxis family, response regulator Rcp1
MSERRSHLKHLVLSEIQRARIEGRRSDLATLVFDALQRAGFSVPNEPSLEDMKWLMAETFRMQRRLLSPLLGQRIRPGSVPLFSDDDDAGTDSESLCDVEEGHFMTEQAVGRPMEILMVEDSLMFARITMGALRNGSIAHRFTWLTDGEEALEFLHRRRKYVRAPRPDLILLDLGLPTIDGREMLASIKSDDALRNIPVVIMTASTSEDDRIESERLDVEAYLTKPVDLNKFLALVKELKSYWHEDMILPAIG